MPTTKDRLEFVHAMAHHTQATVRQCEALMRYAATLQRLAEDQCNREWTERDGIKRRRIQQNVLEVCGKIEGLDEQNIECCHPTFSNDPRGAVLKIRVPDGHTTDMGREGIVVPS